MKYTDSVWKSCCRFCAGLGQRQELQITETQSRSATVTIDLPFLGGLLVIVDETVLTVYWGDSYLLLTVYDYTMLNNINGTTSRLDRTVMVSIPVRVGAQISKPMELPQAVFKDDELYVFGSGK